MKFDRAMIVRGTQKRIVPVLMTALTAGLGPATAAVRGAPAGRGDPASGGGGDLLTSTLLDLVRPLVFWRCGRRAAQRLVQQAFADKPTAATEHPTS